MYKHSQSETNGPAGTNIQWDKWCSGHNIIESPIFGPVAHEL